MMDDNIKNLICKVVDGNATSEEDKIMNELKEKNPEVHAEFNAQKKIADSFRSVGLPELDDTLRQQFISGIYNKIERKTGWILSALGIIFVLGYGVYEFFTQPDINAVYRLGMAAIIVGFGLLLSSVLRGRLKLRKHDKYKEVIR
ncbi:hypothetical protein KAH27_09595 [bacterium]|nr:hypothetical protein [bacterium]